MEQALGTKRFFSGFPPLPGLEEERLQGGLTAGRPESAQVCLLISLPHSISPKFCLSFAFPLLLSSTRP
jgi:hypothetical protein